MLHPNSTWPESSLVFQKKKKLQRIHWDKLYAESCILLILFHCMRFVVDDCDCDPHVQNAHDHKPYENWRRKKGKLKMTINTSLQFTSHQEALTDLVCLLWWWRWWRSVLTNRANTQYQYDRLEKCLVFLSCHLPRHVYVARAQVRALTCPESFERHRHWSCASLLPALMKVHKLWDNGKKCH